MRDRLRAERREGIPPKEPALESDDGARRCDAEWLFHSKELQRSHVPQKLHNLPRSELTTRVNLGYREKSLWIIALNWK